MALSRLYQQIAAIGYRYSNVARHDISDERKRNANTVHIFKTSILRKSDAKCGSTNTNCFWQIPLLPVRSSQNACFLEPVQDQPSTMSTASQYNDCRLVIRVILKGGVLWLKHESKRSAKHDIYGLAILRLQTGDQSHSSRWRLFRRPHNALAGNKIFVRETVHGCFVQSRALSTAEDVSRALSTALLPRCRTPCKFGSRLAT